MSGMNTPALEDVILDAIEGRLLSVNTMMPGQVVAVNGGMCDVQPLLQRVNTNGDPVTLPIIRNCPIGFYRAGKAAIYLPVKVKDLVEIKFCQRSLDIWLSKGGIVDPADARKFNLSDATVYPGCYPSTDPPTAADPNNLVIVNDQSKITLTPDGKFRIAGATDELLSMFAELLSDLASATQLDPLTGEQPAFDVTTIAVFNALKMRVQGLTG